MARSLFNRRALLAIEFAILFFGLPCFFYFHATRWNVHLTLWLASIYALVMLHWDDGFSWHTLWHGTGWAARDRKIAALRFAITIPLIIGLTLYLAPDRLFSFPLHRPFFWLVVMILYPLLSVVPQELVFRSLFFRRYRDLFPNGAALIASNAFCFGLMHAVFHNWVSPLLSLAGGLFFALSYSHHRALKWAALEHAAYGCMVFTVGIGFYFLVGGGRL